MTIGKERKTLFHRADAKRLNPFNLLTISEDQLGRTTTNIQHQPSFIGQCERIRNTHINQPTFLFS